MTVALAYCDSKTNKCHMLADSCASDSLNHSVVRNPKVFNPVGRRDVLIGCAGTFRLPNLLKYIPGIFPQEDQLATEDIDMSYLVNEFSPVVKALTEDFEEDDFWEMLIAVNGKIYRMQMDMSIIEPSDDCEAIGCGGSVALGAFKVLNELEPDMPIEDRMRHALRVACETVQGCCEPFNYITTEEALVKPDKDSHRESNGYEIIRHDDSLKENKKSDTLENKKSKKKKKK